MEISKIRRNTLKIVIETIKSRFEGKIPFFQLHKRRFVIR